MIRNTTTTPYTTPMVDYLPDTYQSGRGFVSIYNPPLDATVPIQLSNFGLVSGQAYTIYDVVNPFVVLASGTYTGATIAVPMTGTTVRTPTFYTIVGTAASRTSDEFKTFYILGGAADAGAPAAHTAFTGAWAFSSQGAIGNVNLNWTVTTAGSATIIEKFDGSTWSAVTTTAADVNTYRVTGLPSVGPWGFRLRASKDGLESMNIGPVTKVPYRMYRY